MSRFTVVYCLGLRGNCGGDGGGGTAQCCALWLCVISQWYGSIQNKAETQVEDMRTRGSGTGESGSRKTYARRRCRFGLTCMTTKLIAILMVSDATPSPYSCASVRQVGKCSAGRRALRDRPGKHGGHGGGGPRHADGAARGRGTC